MIVCGQRSRVISGRNTLYACWPAGLAREDWQVVVLLDPSYSVTLESRPIDLRLGRKDTTLWKPYSTV
jgi:hypothetical protein